MRESGANASLGRQPEVSQLLLTVKKSDDTSDICALTSKYRCRSRPDIKYLCRFLLDIKIFLRFTP